MSIARYLHVPKHTYVQIYLCTAAVRPDFVERARRPGSRLCRVLAVVDADAGVVEVSVAYSRLPSLAHDGKRIPNWQRRGDTPLGQRQTRKVEIRHRPKVATLLIFPARTRSPTPVCIAITSLSTQTFVRFPTSGLSNLFIFNIFFHYVRVLFSDEESRYCFVLTQGTPPPLI